jgi:hypothetical protein
VTAQKATVWGDRTSREALAAMLGDRATAAGTVATTEVTPWSHDGRYRVEARWSSDQSTTYDVSDWGEAVLILENRAASGNQPDIENRANLGSRAVGLDDALLHFDARVAGATTDEAWLAIAVPRLALRKRWRRSHQHLVYGTCPICHHDWGGHPAGEVDLGWHEPCDECTYQIDHHEPGALAEPCRAEAPHPPK